MSRVSELTQSTYHASREVSVSSSIAINSMTTRGMYVRLLTTKFEEQQKWLHAKASAFYPIDDVPDARIALNCNRIEREIMYQMSKKAAYSDHERRLVWLLASGALNIMSVFQLANNGQSYWDIIDAYDRSLPNPNEHQIEVDLKRTFPGEDFYRNTEVIDSLRRICLAFSIRNPEVGYA
jgi:hypothetical protein